MAKVLAIEISASRIRICEEDYKAKNPRVHKTISIRTPDGVVTDGGLELTDELISIMKKVLSENKIKTKQIIFSLNSAKIASREVVLPFVKENKLPDVIRANASDYFPVDLEQYELGHSIISTSDSEKGVKQYKCLVIAVPKNMISSYKQLASSMGCSVLALDYSGNSIYQIVRRKCETGVQMIIKVDENSTQVLVLENQAIALQRSVTYGVEDAIFRVMEMDKHRRPDYETALSLMRENNCLLDEEVVQSLDYLTGGISRVVDFYYRNGGEPIEQAYLTGLGGDVWGLAEVISNALDFTVNSLKEIKGFQLSQHFAGRSFGEYITCIGAAIAPLGLLGEKDKKKTSVELLPDEKGMNAVAGLVFAGGIIVGGALIALSTLSLQAAKDENTQLNDRIAQLAEAEAVYKEYLQQEYTFNKLTYFRNSTVTPNEELVAFIEELEHKMPSSVNVHSFSAELDKVIMNMSVADKDEAAKVIQQLRDFETVSSVGVSSIRDTGAVMEGEPIEEEPRVSFSVEITYKGNEASAVVEEPAPEQTQTTQSDEEILE